jgi:hypothetical protein
MKQVKIHTWTRTTRMPPTQCSRSGDS